jgi:RimJ/RimL family protein N-acetyltransferase
MRDTMQYTRSLTLRVIISLCWKKEMNNIIETDRLALRKIVEEDIEELSELFSDPTAMEYMDGVKTIEEVKEWMSRVFESYRTTGFGPFAVIQKETGEFIGYCGLYLQKDVDGVDEVEILYGLIQHFWNQGFAIEAARAVLEYGKSEHNIKRFITLIMPQNKRSAKVSEKLGMKKEKQVHRWNRQIDVDSLNC